MPIQRNAQALFEYIAEVYSMDLPVKRDVLGYGDERWWQADLIPSNFCKTKDFDADSDTQLDPEDTGGAWLSVLKSACDPPPPLPEALLEWVQLSPIPSKRPSPKPRISKRHRFDEDPNRLSLYDQYRKAWINWEKQKAEQQPGIPEPLKDWLDLSRGESNLPIPIQEKEQELCFEDDKNRPVLLDAFLTTQWSPWSDRTLPAFRANELYDQLFSLRQRLSVEGDRWEILWGHLFLNWQHSPGQAIYHPLLLTPMFLEFNPKKRNITLTPSQPTKFDLECLRDLEYNYKDTLLSLARGINENEEPCNPWSHNTVRGLSSTVSGYLSSKAESETNLYSDKPISRPLASPKPTISNAAIIFVRERVRHFWIEDARKVAAAIAGGAQVPPFIHAAVSDPAKDHASVLDWGNPARTSSQPFVNGNPDVQEEDSELYFPLLHNDQQKEIWERLRHQFGVLVQGPPGTGKSHTIANIISDQLARGKKILVTSQTENALRVLRGHIPAAIRSLCVSQLGNDTESKKQLHEAVTEIGQHLAEKGSHVRQKRIQKLIESLRVIREEHAYLQNQIRDWANG